METETIYELKKLSGELIASNIKIEKGTINLKAPFEGAVVAWIHK